MRGCRSIRPSVWQPVTAVAASSAVLAFWVTGAAAQQVAETVLPAIVVDGATLAKPARKVRKVSPQPSPDVGGPVAKQAQSKKKATAASGASPAADAGGGAADIDIGAASPDGDSSADRGVPRDALGTAVSVVTADDIKAQQIQSASDALRALPGVSVNQQGGAGNVTVVRIRGAESNHTLVVIDGVEVNSNTDGFYDFANLSAAEIERIEVLRGPQSGLYGGGALGGVINIVTKSGKGPLTVTAEGEAGAFETRSGRAGISGGNDRAWAALMVSARETAGFNIAPVGPEKDGSTLKTLNFKGGVKPFENLTVSGNFRVSRLEGDRDDFNGLVGGFFVANDSLSTFSNESWSGRIEAELSLLGGAFVHKVYATKADRDVRDVDRGAFPANSILLDDKTTYGYVTTLRLDAPSGMPVRHYVTALIESQEETFDQPDAGNFHAERGRLSFAGEIRGEYFDVLHLGATVRQDDNDSFDDATNWRLQGSLKVPSTPFRLHASYGTGVKYPSFAELFGTFFRYTPNPDLQPEESRGWDAGIEATLLDGRAILDITYFKADLENEIVDDFSNFPNITSRNLAGSSQRQGVEFAGRFAPVAGITLGASYTWLDAEDDVGLAEIRRPRHQGRFDVDWRSADRRARLNLAAVYNGRSLDNGFLVGPPFATRVTLDDAWLLRLAGSYEVAPGVEMFGRVENLLDQRYQEVFGYETAGIAAYAGLRFKLEASPRGGASLK
ncbi:MAG: TonB-dependent receptor [Hyphomicrobiaceae bacterium]|nr:TonB-dependent receptor [Hyphomicrobiaceae bacterium]